MSWEKLFKEIKGKDYAKKLNSFLDEEYKNHTIFPPRCLMFNAFNHTDPSTIKVVIIGQDPYHEIGQAMGLSFSVPKGIPLPPSLLNIYKEIESDLNKKMDFSNGDLTYLANQGVLLLNARLTVREGEPLSHNIPEYVSFLNDVIEYLNTLNQPIVFMLWGGFAKTFSKSLNNPNHLILTSVHPSPLSANRGGWFGNKHFSKANAYLAKNKIIPIDWIN
jgi:uracil-DNA glycosylase